MKFASATSTTSCTRPLVFVGLAAFAVACGSAGESPTGAGGSAITTTSRTITCTPDDAGVIYNYATAKASDGKLSTVVQSTSSLTYGANGARCGYPGEYIIDVENEQDGNVILSAAAGNPAQQLYDGNELLDGTNWQKNAEYCLATRVTATFQSYNSATATWVTFATGTKTGVWQAASPTQCYARVSAQTNAHNVRIIAAAETVIDGVPAQQMITEEVYY
jgi:hypothetical protein